MPPQTPETSLYVRRAAPRETVHARLPDGRVYEGPPGTPVGDLIAAAVQDGPSPEAAVVAALMDGRLRELHTPIESDASVVPVTVADLDGTRIYRRSLVLLLVTAASQIFPEAEVFVEHPVPSTGGYYCRVRGREPFTREDLDRIAARMRAIVERDEPIVKASVPLDEAIAIVAGRGEADKARLLAHRQKESLVLYELCGRRDYLQGYMVPRTGCLSQFALHAYPPGFVLQYPHQGSPTVLTPFEAYPRLFDVFAETGEWLDRLGIRGVGALNDAIAGGRLPEVSLVAEALHEARLARIAAEIVSAGDGLRVVLVAGPSSSGKTTFSKRLAVQLLVSGHRPFALALDDYFVDRESTPLDEFGQPDFESLTALDVPLFNEHLLSLMAGEPTRLPRYSFLTGRREEGPLVTLDRSHLVIVEGIHGLNPALVPALPAGSVYRVYVSAVTQLNLDRHNRVSISDTRLIRRIVRDAQFRGYSAADTLRRWDAVQRGEKHHIFPFTDRSDAIFNSSLVHELSVLRPRAEPLLLQVRPDTAEFSEANRLLSFLQWFRPALADPVPDNSILREFIGGSILDTFVPTLGGGD